MPKTFYIIDGHAQIFRAYFSPFRDLSAPGGEPTKATFIFTQWLLNLIEARHPEFLAMVIDSGDASVFRKDIYPEYKAHRESPPDDFFPQEKRILQMVRDAGVPVYAKPGAEADDLIATMTRRLHGAGYDIIIVSNDKDLRQLLGPGVRMYSMQSDSFTDAAAVERDLGFTPAQAIDVQTLMGDSTDNVPGVPGVGLKTAAKLVQKYGTADAVYDHLDELTPKLRENLANFKPLLDRTRQLVTLKQDVDFPFKIEECEFHGLRVEGIRPHLQSLGFGSLLKRIEPATGSDSATGATSDGGASDEAARLTFQRARPAMQPFAQGSLFGEIDDPAGAAAPVAPPATCAGAEYRCITTGAQLDAFLTELSKQPRFAFDTETDALGAMRSNLVGMSFSWAPGTGCYIPVRAPAGAEILPRELTLNRLRPILENPAIGKIGHNIKYDILAMRVAGVRVAGVQMDTMVAAFILDASRNSFGIDRLALDLLNFRKIPTSDLIGKGKNQLSMDRVDLPRITTYAAEDADIAWRLAELFRPQLDAIPALRKLNDGLETPLVEVLVEMESNGIAIDPAVLREQSQVLGQRIEALRKRIHEVACFEFNIDSPKQIADVLFNRLKLKSVKSTKTGFSTDVEVLERLADEHACPRLILEYRSLVKLKNTYLDNLTEYLNPRTGRIHASFNQAGAATGRMSCSDPNLQNIPIRTDEGRRIRLAFVPGDPVKNVLLTADYSQIELRVLAHLTGEPALRRAFETDEDVHRTVAAEVFSVAPEAVTREQRAQAKIINFGIIYGVTAMGLARRIDGLSTRDAQKLIDAYAVRFPAVWTFMDQCVMEARSLGYVQTILGRRRPLPEVNSGTLTIRRAGERMAINSVVQGSAADLIKLAMLNIHCRLKEQSRPSRMLLQVHDELVFEVPADQVEPETELIRAEMTGAMSLSVPLKVEIGFGKNWQEVK